MPENSSRVQLVRCPKCGHLLPELPPYSVYHCGGCDAFLRAEKGSSVDDGLSEKSWEERTGEGSVREGNGEIVGIDRGRANERYAASSCVSKSPVRSRYGDAIRMSPMRESNSGDLDVARKSPARGSVLGDFDRKSKSSGRSMDRDVGKPPLRESGFDGRRKSPARSVRVRKSPMRESELGDFDEQRSTERNSVTGSEEMEAREKVGAWFDHVKEEVVYANRLVTQKGSFNEWLDYEASVDESEISAPRVSPRRRTWSLDDSPMGFGLNPRGEQVDRRADQIVDGREFKYDDLFGRRNVEVPDDDWVGGGNHGVSRGHRVVTVKDGYVGKSQSQNEGTEHLRAQRNEFASVHGNDRAVTARQRFPAYPNEGLLNYRHYGYDQPIFSHENFSGSSSLQNRAELVRMYNDLKEQLSIRGDVLESPARRGHQRIASADCYGGPEDYMHDEILRSRRPVASADLDERNRMRPHYMNRSRMPGPFVNDHYMEDINCSLPPRSMPTEFPMDDDPSWHQNPGRTYHHQLHYYPQRSTHDYLPQHRMDSAYDLSGLNHRREDIDHPNNLRAYVQAPPAAFGYRMQRNFHTDPASDYPDLYAQRASGPRLPYPTSHNRSSHSRTSVDSKLDGFDSAQDHSKRVVEKSQNKLLCYPIARGAPFVICYNCSQLLRLPKKLIAMKSSQFRLQCGSCVTTLSFDFDKKRSHASMQLQPKPNSTNVDDVPSERSESDHKNTHDSLAGITNRESYDFDATGYTFPCTDSEPSMQLDRKLNSIEAEQKQGLSPSSSNASKKDVDLDHAVRKIDASSPLMNTVLRPPPGSTLQEHMDYSDVFAAKKSDEKETDDSGHGKGITGRDSSSLDYMQNADVPAELEINSDEIRKENMSQSSAEASRKNDQGGHRKGKSSFGGIGRRGSRDLSPPPNAANAKADVFVNGQPIAHRALRKAEKMAGPISPGKYWYDSRAGFWGIMGSFCLGIIPPFIQEFGFPMPVDCAGGNTGIYVNGRELHEKDLELLTCRGFPCTSNKWYVVDISGKVQDEETGDLVVNLGKLAPTVEKTKRGFGMQPPEMQED